MGSSEEELKSMLVDIGSKLEKPPSSVKEILALLDRVEVYLSRVEQSPSRAIQSALTPTLKALVGDELLRHTDVDVKVAVASCISEITRITAPEVPYDDDLMREVFQLIVSSFESLADKSSPSYSKRTCILETVAKVRSCVVMLDLECDELILEMFRHFIKAIRDYHPENVFSCMENIMNRVIEESEEISSELLFCILDTVKKDNEEVTPVAHKLMTRVIETSADKLRPYIEIAVRTEGVLLSDYADVVNHLCSEVSAEVAIQLERTDTSDAPAEVPASKPAPTAEVVPTAEETTAIADKSVEKFPADGCSDLGTSNGNAGGEADAMSNSSMMPDPKSDTADEEFEADKAGPSAPVCGHDVPEAIETETKASDDIIVDPQTEDGRDSEKADEGELNKIPKAEKIVRKRGRKSKAKRKTSGPKLAGKSTSAVKESDELAESHKSSDKDICPSQRQESSKEAAEHSSPKPSETDDVPSNGVSGETKESEEKLKGPSNSKTIVSSEKHTSPDDQMNKSTVSGSEGRTTSHTVDASEVKATVSSVDASEVKATVSSVDASEVKATVSSVDTPLEKTNAPTDEKMEDSAVPAGDSAQDGDGATVDEPMEEIEPSAEKSPKQSDVPLEDTHDVEDGPSKTKTGIKRRGRGLGKATLQKRAAKAVVENTNKEGTTPQKPALRSAKNEDDLIKSPETSTKRKRDEENKSESKDGGEELVGSKVKVWWPVDKKYYKGVIESFDSAKNKHKVLYADGEVEHLVLKKQRWEVINPDDDDSETEEESDQETPDRSSGKRQKGKEVNEGSSKKRLGRPPSSKSKSPSNKPGRKPSDHAKSGSTSKVETKAGAKAKTDSSKEVGKSKVESIKKLGRPRADASKSAGKSKADESKSAGKTKAEESKSADKAKAEESKSAGKAKAEESKSTVKSEADGSKPGGKSKADGSNPAGKSKADESKPTGKSKADESKNADKSTSEDAQSSGKSKGGDLKTNTKGKSDSKTASKPEAETRSVVPKDPKGKRAKSAVETKSSERSKTRASSKSKSGPAAEEVASKTASAAKSKGKAPKTTPKSKVKAPEKADTDSSGSEESEEAAKEQTTSPAKATVSSKRKAPHSAKGNKSGAKSGQKRKKGRKN
uniref:Uncharacterized protein n=1 Tax=Kalanchoe fedtschenkoi TaxID=63787 RepID=A0A7N0R8M1_KALFE